METEYLAPEMVLSTEIITDHSDEKWAVMKIRSNWMHRPFAWTIEGPGPNARVHIRMLSTDESTSDLLDKESEFTFPDDVLCQVEAADENKGRSSQYGFYAIKLPIGVQNLSLY